MNLAIKKKKKEERNVACSLEMFPYSKYFTLKFSYVLYFMGYYYPPGFCLTLFLLGPYIFFLVTCHGYYPHTTEKLSGEVITVTLSSAKRYERIHISPGRSSFLVTSRPLFVVWIESWTFLFEDFFFFKAWSQKHLERLVIDRSSTQNSLKYVAFSQLFLNDTYM